MEEAQVLGGRYRLERRLGEGGMSIVWQARDEVLGRPVAVKVLAARLASDAGSRDRIRAEAQAVARLSHPHITDVYDYGESVDEHGRRVPYIVMELLPGQTLAHRLAEGPLRPRAAMRVCAEVASALAAAHREGMVHRDVKPANVVLTPDGAKVVDFGIAAAVGQADEYDLDAPVFGTPAYLAPERLTGGDVIAASDVYALGLLLYRMLTNQLPWQVETTTQMLTAHVYAEPSPLPSMEKIPPEVRDIYNRCVAKDPADRPSAGQVADVLARAAGLQLRPEDDPSLVTAFSALQAERYGRDGAPGRTPPSQSRDPETERHEPAGDGRAAGAAGEQNAEEENRQNASRKNGARKRRRRGLLIAAGGLVIAAGLAAGAFALSGPLGDAGPLDALGGGDKSGSAAAHGQQPGVGGGPGGGPGGAGGHPAKPGGTGGVPPGSNLPTAGPGVVTQPTTPGGRGTDGPTDPPPTTGDPQPSDTGGGQGAQSLDKPFSSAGGSLLAYCTAKGKAVVHDLAPADGYTVKKSRLGPANTAGAVFTGPTVVHMRITCSGGEPDMSVDGSDTV